MRCGVWIDEETEEKGQLEERGLKVEMDLRRRFVGVEAVEKEEGNNFSGAREEET